MSPDPSRTTWRAKPCGWRDRERVVALGEEFGPAGPLILDVLEELAKEQRHDGQVRTGLRSLARAAFLPRGSDGVEVARRVLTFGETVGALDDLEIAADADMTVTVRVSGFAADQGKGYEAVRKGRQRSTEPGHSPENGDNDASCPENWDGVPECPPTGQDRTEEQHVEPTRLDDARGRLQAGAVQTVFDEWVRVTGKTGRTVLDEKRRRLIRNALKAYPLDDVLAAVRGWQHSPHHRGENEQRTVYNDLGLLLRDNAHIERFRDLEREHQTGPVELDRAAARDARNAAINARQLGGDAA